jgi:membrane-bound lytic murein transglycosylase A
MRRTAVIGISLGLLAAFVISGCQPKKPVEQGFVRLKHDKAKRIVREIDLHEQGVSSWDDLRPALERSLEYASSRPDLDLAVDRYGLQVPWQEIEQSLERLINLLPKLKYDPGLLAEYFRWYSLKRSPLFTGYYEPQIEASLEYSPEYSHPIYGKPQDLKVADLGEFHPRFDDTRLVYRIEDGQIEPYFDREAIDQGGALLERAPIIAWAKDPVDIFFLQIQGSGRLVLPDGRVQHIGYASKNGRQYVSLGRVMHELGYIDKGQMSMQSIRRYLQNNPELLPEILFTNPSYVFFRLLDGGPYGAMNRELTPMVSLAVDPQYLALGSAMVFSVDLPGKTSEDTLPLTGFGLAQDVGGAIKDHHLDLFCGTGPRAKYTAGHLKKRGEVYLLLPNEKTPPDIYRAEDEHTTEGS